MKKEKYFRTREEWHRWLEEYSTIEPELNIKMYKKHTGKKCIPYVEAVEEALCFGWIDGKIKRINDEYFLQRYTPRRPGSRWSRYNIERVERLIREGRMTEAGMKAYNEIFVKPELVYDNISSGEPDVPEDLMVALKDNTTAYNNFMRFSQSARRIYIEWLKSAKKTETRQVRILKIIEASAQNRKPGII